MADDTPPSDAGIIEELASIVSRTVDLMNLVTTGLDDTPDAKEIAERLRRMERHKEAKELEMPMARAEELRSASSASS